MDVDAKYFSLLFSVENTHFLVPIWCQYFLSIHSLDLLGCLLFAHFQSRFQSLLSRFSTSPTGSENHLSHYDFKHLTEKFLKSEWS